MAAVDTAARFEWSLMEFSGSVMSSRILPCANEMKEKERQRERERQNEKTGGGRRVDV